MLDVLKGLLCSKLCRHKIRTPTTEVTICDPQKHRRDPVSDPVIVDRDPVTVHGACAEAESLCEEVMIEIASSTLFEVNVVGTYIWISCFMKDWLIYGPCSVFNLS